MNDETQVSRLHLGPRRLMVLVITGVFALANACGDEPSDSQSAPTTTTAGSSPAVDGGAASSSSPPSPSSPSSPDTSGSAAGRQLDVDPCSLLTVPEIEVAIGRGVEHGGLGEDTPGRCTYSVGGDVGAGVVGISVDQPYLCGPLLQALEDGSLDEANAVRVDIGDGGVFEPRAGSIQFAVGGGCVGIVGSTGGESLGQDALVALATSAAGRVG